MNEDEERRRRWEEQYRQEHGGGGGFEEEWRQHREQVFGGGDVPWDRFGAPDSGTSNIQQNYLLWNREAPVNENMDFFLAHLRRLGADPLATNEWLRRSWASPEDEQYPITQEGLDQWVQAVLKSRGYAPDIINDIEWILGSSAGEQYPASMQNINRIEMNPAFGFGTSRAIHELGHSYQFRQPPGWEQQWIDALGKLADETNPNYRDLIPWARTILPYANPQNNVLGEWYSNLYQMAMGRPQNLPSYMRQFYGG